MLTTSSPIQDKTQPRRGGVNNADCKCGETKKVAAAAAASAAGLAAALLCCADAAVRRTFGFSDRPT